MGIAPETNHPAGSILLPQGDLLLPFIHAAEEASPLSSRNGWVTPWLGRWGPLPWTVHSPSPGCQGETKPASCPRPQPLNTHRLHLMAVSSPTSWDEGPLDINASGPTRADSEYRLLEQHYLLSLPPSLSLLFLLFLFSRSQPPTTAPPSSINSDTSWVSSPCNFDSPKGIRTQ